MKRNVAGEHACGRGDGDVARCRPTGNNDCQISVGDDGEAPRHSIHRNIRRPGETLTENLSGLADFARGLDEGYKWAEAHVKAVHGAAPRAAITPFVASPGRISVEGSSGGLKQVAGRAHAPVEVKSCSMVKAPLLLMLNSVPQP